MDVNQSDISIKHPSLMSMNSSSQVSLNMLGSVMLTGPPLPMCGPSSILLPCPSPSPRAQTFFTPSPSPISMPMSTFPFLSRSLPSTSPELSRFPSPVAPIAQSQLLSQFVGDWVTLADSRSPRKHSNMSNAPVKRVSFEHGVCRVVFSELQRSMQDYQIRVSPDGRFQLFSPSNPGYSFYLLQSVIGSLHWQNEIDANHIVTWTNVGSLRNISNRSSEDTQLPSQNPMLRYAGSSIYSESNVLHPEMLPLPMDLPISAFDDEDLMDMPRSRNASPEPEVLPELPALAPKRDSKQNLVNAVEPEVDARIGHLYAKKSDYRANQSGRVGPPVLRGDDVLFIPAKKQAALENIVELINQVQGTSTIVAAAKVCQKKKKRQKKGFLVYLKLSSAEEVQNVLRNIYPQFASSVHGVKAAIFKNN